MVASINRNQEGTDWEETAAGEQGVEDDDVTLGTTCQVFPFFFFFPFSVFFYNLDRKSVV